MVSGGGTPNDLAPALDEVFVTCGAAALASRMTSGSCVAIAMMLHAGGLPWVVSANVGDSRTVLVSWDDDGSRLEGAALSVDHKLGPAKTSEETRRVQASAPPCACPVRARGAAEGGGGSRFGRGLWMWMQLGEGGRGRACNGWWPGGRWGAVVRRRVGQRRGASSGAPPITIMYPPGD